VANGVGTDAIHRIPDEQEAIDAALKMSQHGDLLLIFADALARSWKQVTKYRPAGAESSGNAVKRVAPVIAATEEAVGGPLSDATLEASGFVRDARGLRFVKDSED
jgi:cyanophycin synthetase